MRACSYPTGSTAPTRWADTPPERRGPRRRDGRITVLCGAPPTFMLGRGTAIEALVCDRCLPYAVRDRGGAVTVRCLRPVERGSPR